MSKCIHCSKGETIVESRKDAFATANSLLRDAGLPKPGDGEVAYGIGDVLTLAAFLLGAGEYGEDE